jgi:hypothetical protein
MLPNLKLTAKTALVSNFRPDSPVWVWDGLWLPGVVAEVVRNSGQGFLVVQFQHGVSAPVAWADVIPRNPELGGSDRPQRRGLS